MAQSAPIIASILAAGCITCIRLWPVVALRQLDARKQQIFRNMALIALFYGLMLALSGLASLGGRELIQHATLVVAGVVAFAFTRSIAWSLVIGLLVYVGGRFL
jgi:hypothetical protein